MKTFALQLMLGLLAATVAQADTALTINPQEPTCLSFLNPFEPPPTVTGTFTLTNAYGAGIIQSSLRGYAENWQLGVRHYLYSYSIIPTNLVAFTEGSHCVRVVIHFGEPQFCDLDAVWGDPSQIQSAGLAAFGDITLTFAGGCLALGGPPVNLAMFSDTPPITNVVTVIDDYVDPTSGQTNETRISVPAIVPAIPPNPIFDPNFMTVPNFQGYIGLVNSNSPSGPHTNGYVNGTFDITAQLLNSLSNGLAISPIVTQTVQVVNGVFNLPMPFAAVAFCDGSVRYLQLGIRPSVIGGTVLPFMPLDPPMVISPVPQALYAYTAGSVAGLAPGQAVTRLNGLTDGVMLEAGMGITLMNSGNMITIGATGTSPSDRHLKTDIVPVNPEALLAKLTAMPIESWRFTNELAGVRHLGPMAQDFRAAFGLGNSDKMIGYLDASGVALAAIQGLNQKLSQELQREETENAQLRQQVAELKKLADQINQKLDPGTK